MPTPMPTPVPTPMFALMLAPMPVPTPTPAPAIFPAVVAMQSRVWDAWPAHMVRKRVQSPPQSYNSGRMPAEICLSKNLKFEALVWGWGVLVESCWDRNLPAPATPPPALCCCSSSCSSFWPSSLPPCLLAAMTTKPATMTCQGTNRSQKRSIQSDLPIKPAPSSEHKGVKYISCVECAPPPPSPQGGAC